MKMHNKIRHMTGKVVQMGCMALLCAVAAESNADALPSIWPGVNIPSGTKTMEIYGEGFQQDKDYKLDVIDPAGPVKTFDAKSNAYGNFSQAQMITVGTTVGYYVVKVRDPEDLTNTYIAELSFYNDNR